MTFTLSGGSCPIAENMTIKGSLFGKSENKTGVAKTAQAISFSESINSNAGGSLKVGSEKAVITGTTRWKAGGLFFGVK